MTLAMTAQQERGLTAAQALENITKYGANVLDTQRLSAVSIFIRQFRGNYLLYILITCTVASFFLGEKTSSLYIFFMILLSSVLGFWNEYSAQKTVDTLLKRITPKALVKRDGRVEELPISHITVGDIVLLSTGSVIPADLSLVEAENLEVNESALTGESFPVTKQVGDMLYMGTNIEAGRGFGEVVQIGRATKYGKIAKSLSFLKPETSFQTGLRNFGNLLVKVIIILTLGIFGANFALGKDWLTSLMFALAIAVGLTPELLPVVVTLSLSHGAGRLFKKHVVVKRLVSIENLGNMDVLCTDKTGTLTEGKIDLIDYVDLTGQRSIELLNYAYISAPKVAHSKHFQNPIDRAIEARAGKNGVAGALGNITYLDSEPFDYTKKASFAVANYQGQTWLLVKGVYESVLNMCLGPTDKVSILAKTQARYTAQGHRTVLLAGKIVSQIKANYSWQDATGLQVLGLLAFSDVLKKDTKKALDKLEKLNIDLKVLTGDNETVSIKLCQEAGLSIKGVVLGSQIQQAQGKELAKLVCANNVFARVTPEDKLKIIAALKAQGHAVGFLGDGVNDAPALHAADVGISVEGASDVAKEAAGVVLMKKGLDVIADGVMEGRTTFNNTVKYILMGTSSNFGNMFSASLASVLLPFLPMTPVQILLNNTLYDFSQITIPSDQVDKESLLKPRKWDIGFIRKYMTFFGPISSLFDFITFFVLYKVFAYGIGGFQTGWFLESLTTQVLIIFVIRTARTPFWRSKPAKALVISSIVVVLTAIVLIFSPFAHTFGFVPLRFDYFIFLAVIVAIYLAVTDVLKRFFINRFQVWN
ncbi:MAG: Magnesium-translocating P-type ATPase [candidate division WWE3 bacterium GW2011_GWB1_44_4]|uniref:Magnesium-transporting ATPase, P-type 1 n=2 Tax=Katanobacteria TaxID=422282 RepID=A0A0G1JDI8_UNCKA|nr:MAG: Magnesium-translocating P-type ATPase [candidate division WWE3 bacterium GW2011_GWB1_44_4]